MKWTNFNIQTFKSLIYFLLIPLSFIYGSIIAIRNLLFDYGIFKAVSHNIPIICIGNLSVGGTGKTPHTQYIINLLKPDYKVAILSRGYGRKTSTLQYVETTSTATEVGDEPLQLKLNNPDCIVVVEKNRNKGVKKILKDFPETQVILLDDGYQHRWIKAGFNILITPYESPFYKDNLMPVGNLRESKKGAERANAIVFSKTPENINPTLKKGMLERLHLFAHQKAYFSHINYCTLRCISTNKEFTSYQKYSITLVSGIANPKPLVDYLENAGHNITHLKFADHHNYTSNDIANILAKHNADKSAKKLILTTEKDATKLKQFLTQFKDSNFYYIPIEIKIEQEDKFEKQILNYVAKN
ncbi:MAG: tetraacyldisaccharide 4'-kinase [Flavobacteriales bacterium]|jgi:tetraacyldisaccharide 4'-kinase|nr:tetraacyldisaccharide 4'-kinase [Flavobacteriales bacterium]